MPRYVRPLSPLERLWLVADLICPPFVNQLVLEGVGRPDPGAWRAAVTRAAEANPGARVVLEGVLGRCRWVDRGAPPPVREVRAPDWDGMGPGGASFLRHPLPFREGPTADVWLVRGPVDRVVLRTHHGTMDGRGTLRYVADVFRALRGERPLGAPNAVTDLELARALGRDRPSPGEDCVAPTGRHDGGPTRVTWARRTIAGRPSAFLPRVASFLAGYARRHGEDGAVRFEIPVDLRGGADLRSTANLTGLVAIEAPPAADPARLAAAIRAAIAAGRHADLVVTTANLRWVPLAAMREVALARNRTNNARSRYSSSGVLSNLGRLPLGALQAPDFATTTAFFIPPGGHATALFAAFCGRDDAVEAVVTMPEPLASRGRLDALMDAMADDLGAGARPDP